MRRGNGCPLCVAADVDCPVHLRRAKQAVQPALIMVRLTTLTPAFRQAREAKRPLNFNRWNISS